MAIQVHLHCIYGSAIVLYAGGNTEARTHIVAVKGLVHIDSWRTRAAFRRAVAFEKGLEARAALVGVAGGIRGSDLQRVQTSRHRTNLSKNFVRIAEGRREVGHQLIVNKCPYMLDRGGTTKSNGKCQVL